MSDFSGVMASLNSGDSGSSGASSGESAAAAPPAASSAETWASSDATEAAPTAPSTSADTEQDATGTTPDAAGTTRAPGAIPYPRFQEVVQQRQQLEQRLQQLSWAQAIPSEAAPAIQQLYQSLQADPIGTLVNEAEALMQSGNPEAAQALRSAAARWLRGARGAPAAPEIDLTPSLQSEDGRAVYTADQVQALVDQKVAEHLGKLEGRIKPFEEQAQEQRVQQMVSEIRSRAKAQADEVRSYPHFAEHKDAILSLLRSDPTITPEKAWMKVVLPTLTLRQQQQAVQTLQAKAQAGAVAPGRAAVGSPPPKPTTFGEAYRQAWSEQAAR